jgi:glycosyltransferase involved in cell wall biosynthesis
MRNLVILPAHDQQEALLKAVGDLEALPADFEILIVDDGSTEGTSAVADSLCSRHRVHVLHLPVSSGPGVAMQTGYLFALRDGGYRYAVQFDPGFRHEVSWIPSLVEECESKGLDLCIGSRFSGKFEDTLLPAWRIRYLVRLIAWMSGSNVADSTSPLRCAGPRAWAYFARRYPEDYPEPLSLYWCVRNKLRVGELPIHVQGREDDSNSLPSPPYLLQASLAILIDSLRRKEFFQP